MKYVQIISSRPVGKRCFELAEKRLPPGWKLIEQMDRPHNLGDGGVVISVLYADVIKEFYPRQRYYNFHPGILPEYAGSATLSWSILNGEREAGCTLHELVREVDGGDIIDIRKFPIMRYDTAESLAGKFTEFAQWMFVDWFERLLEGGIEMRPQDKSKRRNYKRSEIYSELDLTRRIRAFTFEGKEEPFFVAKDGTRFGLSYDRGVIIHKKEQDETIK